MDWPPAFNPRFGWGYFSEPEPRLGGRPLWPNSCNMIIRAKPELPQADIQLMGNPIRFDAQPWFPGLQAALTGNEISPGDQAQSDAELDDYIRKRAVVCQPVGTCSMGVGADAVVDPQLRVRGIEGLRVADASIMPTVPGAKAATIMVGEEAADLLRGRRLPAETVRWAA